LIVLCNIFITLGLSYQENGELQNALNSYDKVIKLNGMHLPSKLNKCNILFASGGSNVEICYLDILSIDETYVRGIVNLGAYYQSLNNDLLAIKYYEKALLLDPTNVMAMHGITSLKITKSNDKENRENENYIKNGLDSNYVTELFDSYSFHFENSLLSLDYKSHVIVGNAVGKYLNSWVTDSMIQRNPSFNENFFNGKIIEKNEIIDDDNSNENSGENNRNDNNNNNNEDLMDNDNDIGYDNNSNTITPHAKTNNDNTVTLPIEEIDIYGVDLGAGTGLTCGPVNYAVKSRIEKYNEYVRHLLLMKNDNNENYNSDFYIGRDKNDDSENFKNNKKSSNIDDISKKSSNKDSNNGVNNYKNDKNAFLISPYIGIIGVDLSSKMLLQSKKKNCYADTVVSDVTLFVQNYAKKMRKNTEHTNTKNDKIDNKNENDIDSEIDSLPQLDFIVAADVFMYLGDLKNVLEASYQVLKLNGLLVFTVEALNVKNDENKENKVSEDDEELNGEKEIDNNEKVNSEDVNFSLQLSGRIAHSYYYLKQIAIQSNYTILELSEQLSRKDKGLNVKGYLVVLRK
jgi:predicted TPR repeat methyltransferase